MSALDDFKRPIMLHVCKDGTVSYRDQSKREKVFNGAALPVFSVETIEQAKQIQIRFCRLQYGSHPLQPDRPWFKLTTFSGELDDLDRISDEFRAFYQALETAKESIGRSPLRSRAARDKTPRPSPSRKSSAK